MNYHVAGICEFQNFLNMRGELYNERFESLT
jgi:hypothetical protein